MPKQDTKNHTPAKQFRLGPEVLEKLDALAAYYAVDRTTMIKVAVCDYFKRAVESQATKKNPKKSNLPS